MTKKMDKENKNKLALSTPFIIFFSLFLFLLGVFFIFNIFKSIFNLLRFPLYPLPPKTKEVETIAKFSSEAEFKAYLEEISQREYFEDSRIRRRAFERFEITEPEEERLFAPSKFLEKEATIPERVAETTVQVMGIDEPDIVKTDGKRIYFSSEERRWYWSPEPTDSSPTFQKTKIIKAFPLLDLAIKGTIDEIGNLLLDKDRNILIVFSSRGIFAYDVSLPESPEKKWEIKWEGNSSLAEARFYKDKIYLVTKSFINQTQPCPIKPLIIKGDTLIIDCQEIYHPITPVPVDTTFLAMILNPDSGEIEKKVSFIGLSGTSVVYMSEKAIYVTYSYQKDSFEFFLAFFKERGQDLLPNSIFEKIERLENYIISIAAKRLELEIILKEFLDSLKSEEKSRIENEFFNRMSDYYKKHKRELEKTGIVKIELDKFEIATVGSVPGFPLNQFALDEYQNNLRIATTVGERWFRSPEFGGFPQESANDVYVLDKDLKIIGTVEDLGITEKIYSARFIRDKGYLVTFREIDPFYILDLSDPSNPQVKGELKIPGYSSYLHPITENRILGIGKERGEIKISLFDVSQPENPLEVNKYILKEYWSDILKTHHAFLLDVKYEIFFLPGTEKGYIFSYKNDQLELKKVVEKIRAKRALYLDDYLYIIGEDKITVLDEKNWEKINELKL